MASNVSLTTLIATVRQRADIEGETLRFPDSELIAYINKSITELYDLLVTADEEYFLSQQLITTVSGTSSYALSADFYKVKGVDINIGTSQLIAAKPFMFAERNAFQNQSMAWGYDTTVYYRLRGNNIVFLPAPSGALAVTVWYIPTPGVLVAGSDTLDGVNGWEELVVADVAIKVGLKDEIAPEDMATRQARKSEALSRISTMKERDPGAPQRIIDTSAQNVLWPFRGAY